MTNLIEASAGTHSVPSAAEKAVAAAVALRSGTGHSENTIKAYASAFGGFKRYCEEEGVPSLPASVDTVARYIELRALSGKSASALRTDVAAIKTAHREARRVARAAELNAVFPDPTENEDIRDALRNLAGKARKEHPSKQACALTSEALAAIKATACNPRTGVTGRTETKESALRRGKVDIALCSTMRDCALRREEVVRITWGAVDFRPDGSATLDLSSRKGNDAGYTGYLTRATVKALNLIRPVDVQDTDRIFPMTPRSIRNRIASACKAAGVEGRFSGHSRENRGNCRSCTQGRIRCRRATGRGLEVFGHACVLRKTGNRIEGTPLQPILKRRRQASSSERKPPALQRAGGFFVALPPKHTALRKPRK